MLDCNIWHRNWRIFLAPQVKKGLILSEIARVIDFLWKILGCRSIFFEPNQLFLTLFCVISYISSSYQTSVDRKFKKVNWDENGTTSVQNIFWENQVFQCQDRCWWNDIASLNTSKIITFPYPTDFPSLPSEGQLVFEYFKNGTASAYMFFCYSTGTLVFTCIKISC